MNNKTLTNAEIADLVTSLALHRSLYRTAREASATHRCKVCDAKWIQWKDGNWTLASDKCGKCCDCAPMGEQIEAIGLTAEVISLKADLATMTQRANEAEAQRDNLKASVSSLHDSLMAAHGERIRAQRTMVDVGVANVERDTARAEADKLRAELEAEMKKNEPVTAAAKVAVAIATAQRDQALAERDRAAGLLRDARGVVESFAARNPKWVCQGVTQDPSGAHATLAQIDAFLAEIGKGED